MPAKSIYANLEEAVRKVMAEPITCTCPGCDDHRRGCAGGCTCSSCFPRARRPFEQWLLQAWKVLQPSPVELHKIPGWLYRRLRTACKEGRWTPRYGRTAYDLLLAAVAWAEEAGDGYAHLLDHWGTTRRHGREEFVTEPYEMNLPAAQRFAELLGLGWYYSPASWWYPGSTFRIGFYLPAEGKEGTGGRWHGKARDDESE